MARDIVPRKSFQPPPKSVQKLARKQGISEEFFTTNFNRHDLQYWYHKFTYKRLAQRITDDTNTDQEKVEAVYDEVAERLDGSVPDTMIEWPYNTWKGKKGVCDRKSWLAGELLYQLGFDYTVIYFRDPETKGAPHTILEARNSLNSWIIDAQKEVLLNNTSMGEFVRNRNSLPDEWETFGEAPYYPNHWISAYPQSYAQRNQILAKKVRSVMENAPRFGRRPTLRLREYMNKPKTLSNKIPYRLWFYPFRLLQYEKNIVNELLNHLALGIYEC